MLKSLTTAIALVLLLSSALSAQEDGSIRDILNQKSEPDCQDFYSNALNLIPTLLEEQQYDSVQVVTAFLEENNCFVPAERRLEVLVAIQLGTFDEEMYDSTIIDEVLWYKNHFEDVGELEEPTSSRGWDYDVYRLELQLRNLARSLMQREMEGSVEYYWARLFSPDPDFALSALRGNRYTHTDLWRYYTTALHRLEDSVGMSGPHYGGSIGFWVPTGNLSLLGPKPAMGVLLGMKSNLWEFNLLMGFQFTNSDETYLTEIDGDFVETNEYFGGFIGIEATYEWVHQRRFGIEMLFRLGAAGFDSEKDSDDEVKTFWSVSGAVGQRVRFFLDNSRSWYIGVEGCYNVFDFDNEAGTSLQGNAWSVSLVVGHIEPGFMSRLLNELKG